MLNLRQLEAFRRVMETGSVTQAASEMLLTQPAVSRLITALEDHVGFALFRRERQRLLITAEGRIFYNEVTALFVQFSRVERIAGGLRRFEAGSLNIASAPVVGLSIMPRIIESFRKERPEIEITLEIRSSMKLLELAAMQQVDIAVGLLPSDLPTVQCDRLYVGEWVCVLPAAHRLAERDLISASDLAGEPFISLGDEDRTRHLVDRTFERAGVTRIMRTAVHLGMAACEFVRLGGGVTLLDPVTAYSPVNSDLAIRRFKDPPNFELLQLLPLSREASSLRDAFAHHMQAWIADWCSTIGNGEMLIPLSHLAGPQP